MASTSSSDLAERLLGHCLNGTQWPADLSSKLATRALTDIQATRALFGIVIERLGDLFEPRLCDTYARLFSGMIGRPDLYERYQRVREPRVFRGSVRIAYVLSRITLGADVAVTSVVLDGLKRRFPEAEIRLVAPLKNLALFAGDTRVRPYPVDTYGGTLRDRLAASQSLNFDEPGSIVVDPDSRLTQLGLIPVCADEQYYFFESRSYGHATEDPLPLLTARWLEDTFGVAGARAYVGPSCHPRAHDAAVSFGVGENLEKRVGPELEAGLLRGLGQRGLSVVVDNGASAVETGRVEQAVAAAAGGAVVTWQGDYAPFAGMIADSRLYCGYDSAGQHVAASCGVPLVSVFAGFVCDRTFARWRPAGPGPVEVVKVAPGEPESEVLARTLQAVDRLGIR